MNVRKIVAIVVTTVAVGCSTSPSPVSPTPVPQAAPPQITPSVLRARFSPTEVYAGGATQIHVVVLGYDAQETLRPAADVHVEFSTDRERLLVLHGRTTETNDAVALLEVGRSSEHYTVRVRVEAAGMTEVLRVPVCACRP